VIPPRVSIVVPTRNGADTLPALLDAIARQRVEFPIEKIAVDSASTDGTLELLRGRVDHLITIDRNGFNHGLTRNIGIERASGDFIVLIVQDAMPADDTWLERLTAPLVADVRLAGTFARQVPRPDASAIARHYLDQWTASSPNGRTSEIESRTAFELLSPRERFEHCVFDNVCSCIRRSVWLRQPFVATSIAEDLEWAKEVLLTGYRLAYVPEAVVIHSHDRSARYELLRTYLLHQRLYELFGLRTIPSLGALSRAVGSSLAVHLRLVNHAGGVKGTRARALALALAWPLGQYLGARSAARGGRRVASGPAR
jgi:glycosyltransferase involved in cell wall biosynthesis